jgi:hypothetical protein
MRKSALLGWAAAAALVVAFPATAQDVRAQFRVRPPAPVHRPGVQGHVFVPGFGLRPIIRHGYPVPGFGFDMHHFNVTRGRRHGFSRFDGAFVGGGFHGQNNFGMGFFSFPFFPVVGTSTTVVVVPQVIPVEVPVGGAVARLEDNSPGEIVVAAGLPYNWSQLRIAESSVPRERVPLPLLTLIVLKDQTIIPVTEYWLEDGSIFYLTSTGRQDSVAVRDLDWEMTTQLNAERNVDFVLRSR